MSDLYAGDVCTVARALIGAVVRHGETAGVIVETEAYHESEPACHAWVGRTPRTITLFGTPGTAYVYRSYGIHWCLNFVCGPEGSASAVLIRAIEPIEGLAAMRRRRGVSDERLLCAGPGRLCEALGISGKQNGMALDAPPFALFGRNGAADVVAGPRIGITKAVDNPWRYGLKGSRFLSKPFSASSGKVQAGFPKR